MIYPITPIPKPRMTQRDKWAKRPCVERYFAFKDTVRILHVGLMTGNCHIIFWMPMPGSWSKKKKKAYDGLPHQQKPDLDNMIKALCDAVHRDDSIVWDLRATKRWSYEGNIEINLIKEEP